MAQCQYNVTDSGDMICAHSMLYIVKAALYLLQVDNSSSYLK